jgi:hypothetical protein
MRPIDADELLDEICRDQCERKYKDCDGTCEIAAYVVNAPTIGGWISVKDRLPESGKPVLVTCEMRSLYGYKNGMYAKRTMRNSIPSARGNIRRTQIATITARKMTNTI